MMKKLFVLMGLLVSLSAYGAQVWNPPSGSLNIDVVNESTSGAGVTIDGVLLKDYNVTILSALTGTANNALTVSVPNQPSSGNTAGKGITITADKGGTKAGGGGAGGAVTINAGDAGGDTGNIAGGSITLHPGAPINSGAQGNVVIPINHALTVNTINETTADTGVTIDGVLVKDGNVSGGRLQDVTAKATTGAVTAAESGVVTCDAAGGEVTLTLPDANGNTGLTFTFKKITATNNCIIDGLDADTIDGALTQTLTGQWALKQVVSDGTNWLITASNSL